MFVITGGGSGIGRALALALAARDKSVLIIGRREHLLQETSSLSSRITYLCADVATEEGLQHIVTNLHSIHKIDALINNAGTLNPITNINSIELNQWHHSLRTNLDAALYLPQKLKTQLANGRVLNVGSGAAYFPIQGWATYCVSKAALSMLTRCWQTEENTVSFASVKPGIVDTEMQFIAREGHHMDPEHVAFYRRLHEHKRLIPAETVAEFLSWILLDTDRQTFSAQEWDIYETSHHANWLKAPHHVLHWEF